MLVVDGQAIELGAHLERLAASLFALYRAKPPANLAEVIAAHAEPLARGRLRLTLAPAATGLTVDVATAEIEAAEVFPSSEHGIALCSFAVAEGLGAHKWADRRLLEQAEIEVGPGALPLLVNAGGAALEASRGSLFAVDAEALRTPPVDGSILPGIARRQVLEVAREAGIPVEEEHLTLADLRQAGEAFLAGSVRGVEPVRSLDGADLALPGALSSRIAADLRSRWLRHPRGVHAAAGAGEQPGDPPVH